MNKNRFGALILLLLGLGLSCSLFSPDTNLGTAVVNSVDSTVTDLKSGFVKLDSIFLAVSGARSVVVPGADTSAYLLASGVHLNQMVAGRLGNDSVVSYAEFHVTNVILSTLKTACKGGPDSIYLQLNYNPTVNDTSLKDSLVHVKVVSCGRKVFPRVRNDLTVADSVFFDTLTFSRRHVDTTYYVPLGQDMISLLDSVVADTQTYAPHIGESNTSIGWSAADSARPVRPDTQYIKDSVVQTFSDTFINTTITGLLSTMHGDTAIIGYTAGSTSVFDTLPFVRSVISDTSISQDSLSIVNYSVWRERTITQRLVYDSAQKYIGSVHIYATAGGGIVRFVGPPVFRIRYRNANCDTALSTWGTFLSYSLAYYFDITSTEQGTIPADSLVMSWQADRFVEIPVDLTPLWNYAAGGGNGKTYSVVQNATCFLNASLFNVEKAGSDSTQRKIVYGLLDHRITDSRAHANATLDSLLGILAAGRLANDSIVADTTRSKVSSTISLPVTIFAQSLYEENPRPATAYLYLWVRTATDFARAVIRKPATVKFTALFSNPQK